MILSKIKEITGKEGKKISKKAIEKINQIIEKNIKEIIRSSARNADFAGRKTIKERDIAGE